MKHIKLSKAIMNAIDNPETDFDIEIELGGFPAFIAKDEFGDFKTPNGTRFMIGFYNPNEYTLKVNF